MANDTFKPHKSISEWAHVSSMEQYRTMYDESIENPSQFWCRIAKQFHWESPVTDPDNLCSYNFDISKGPISTKWMDGATTNICYNLLDRNVRNGHADNVAFYWWVYFFFSFLYYYLGLFCLPDAYTRGWCTHTHICYVIYNKTFMPHTPAGGGSDVSSVSHKMFYWFFFFLRFSYL